MSKSRVAILLTIATLIVAALGCEWVVPPDGTPAPTLPPAAVPSPLVPEPAEEPANELEAQVIAVYEQAAPAVVNITARTIAYDFFMRAIPQEGTGSGFVYDTGGHIVTNYHVVANAESVSVALCNGEVYEAQIVGADPSADLAVLTIEAENLPDPIRWATPINCEWGSSSSPLATLSGRKAP